MAGVVTLNKRWLWAVPILLVLVFNLYDPVSFIGGGADDSRYLAGAACWLANGPCLPVNHWEGRWPLVAPLAASVGLFGVNRFAIALPSLVASLCCLGLLKWHGDRLFGRPVGLAAALILGITPAFVIQTMSATVEPIELAAILAGLCAIFCRRAFLGGLFLGLAFQIRETSIMALPIALFLLRRDARGLLGLSAGFALPLIAELIIFYLETGDPFFRRTLSVRHTLIPSSELRLDVRGLPFFNVDLIANWRLEPGIRVHWLIDGILNLLVNVKTALLYLIAPAYYFLYRDRFTSQERTVLNFILAVVALYTAGLIYGLSIDPKPRMMFGPLAGLCLVLGAVAVRAWGVLLGGTFVALVPLIALTLASQPRQRHWEMLAERMVASYPDQIETGQSWYYKMSPRLGGLPAIGSGKPYLLLLKSRPCLRPSPVDDPVPLNNLALVEQHGSKRLNAAFGGTWHLCLFRYANGFRPARAGGHPDPDGPSGSAGARPLKR